MRVLVIGGGGREHAIIWKLKKSPLIEKIFCAPGNFGIKSIAECADINVEDFDALIDFAKQQRIDLTVVGPDDPLVGGIVDAFEAEGLKVFGPRKNAAMIEGSKAFSKNLMKKYNIPTASYEVFESYDKAVEYVRNQKMPVVIKADGLALGKGVLICNTLQEAEKALDDMFISKKFGKSGTTVVIEEFIEGPEVSILAFCDGKTIVPMVSAQDHKRALDGDKGLNTGGMGTFSPSRFYNNDIALECMENIFKPTVNALISEGICFKGIIFFGLMLTKDGAKVIEYNARFGDPETQVVLPRLKTDLAEIMLACIEGTLDKLTIDWYDNACACVILASGGYPESYEKGFEISGINNAEENENVIVFHAGTTEKDGITVTNGGRVLGVTGIGSDLDEAIKTSYSGVGKISFSRMHYRNDIGIK